MKTSTAAKSQNPLATKPKREKKGSETFRKYDYQYHWAFCRLLHAQSEGADHAVFMEEHTDVTFANTLDATKVEFEFNQVKETNKSFTIGRLVSKPSGAPSVLCKLASDATGKTFALKIQSVRLVCSSGFSFEQHDSGFNYETIEVGTLSSTELAALKNHLVAELGTHTILASVKFVVSDLPAKDFENAVRGRISQVVEGAWPGSHCRTASIYSCIIEDLHRKGENEFDYTNWDDAVKRKAVTGAQVLQIMNQNVTRKGDAALMNQLLHILTTEYKLNSTAQRAIHHSFQRYYEQRLSTRTLLLMDVAASIRAAIAKHQVGLPDAPSLEASVKASVSSKYRAYFSTDMDFRAAFLYEFLTQDVV